MVANPLERSNLKFDCRLKFAMILFFWISYSKTHFKYRSSNGFRPILLTWNRSNSDLILNENFLLNTHVNCLFFQKTPWRNKSMRWSDWWTDNDTQIFQCIFKQIWAKRYRIMMKINWWSVSVQSMVNKYSLPWCGKKENEKSFHFRCWSKKMTYFLFNWIFVNIGRIEFLHWWEVVLFCLSSTYRKFESNNQCQIFSSTCFYGKVKQTKYWIIFDEMHQNKRKSFLFFICYWWIWFRSDNKTNKFLL